MKNYNTRRTNNFDTDHARKNIIVGYIENFIEKNNRYIQAILLIVAIIFGVVSGLAPETMQIGALCMLLLDIFMELYVLQVKDSIMQKKINWIGVDVTTQNGGLCFEDDIDIDEYQFIGNAKKSFLISGIAPSRFISKYETKMVDMLKNNKDFNIYILISGLDIVSENCALYYGSRNEDRFRYDLLSKLHSVINAIENNEVLKKALVDKKLILALSNITFTSSYVAYDIWDAKKSHSKMKITFYQQGEHKPGRLPSVLIDSDRNIRDLFPFFKDNIEKQLKAAHTIKSEEELINLRNELLLEMQKCDLHSVSSEE